MPSFSGLMTVSSLFAQAANPPMPDFPIPALLMAVVGVLGSLVCGIIISVKMFQNDNTALGVITLITLFCTGIGYLIALVYGWMKAGAWRIQNLMIVYSILIVVAIAGYAMMFPALMKMAAEQQQQQMQMQGVPKVPAK